MLHKKQTQWQIQNLTKRNDNFQIILFSKKLIHCGGLKGIYQNNCY